MLIDHILKHVRTGLALLTIIFLPATSSATSLNRIRLVPDINAPFQGVEYTDADVISKGPGGAGAFPVGFSAALPEAVGVDAMMFGFSQIAFSSDVGFDLNGQHYADDDFILYAASSGIISMFTTGSSLGIPESADVDAMTIKADTVELLILMSFSTTVQLPGGITAADHDVVIWSNGVFSIAYDGVSDLGIEESADIVGLHDSTKNLFFSLDKSATIAGQQGTDHDVWLYNKAFNITVLATSELGASAEIAALDYPTDTDGDWLTDFEEASGIDDPASTIPGSSIALLPTGTSDPNNPDSDEDNVPDGEEAAAGTSSDDDSDYLQVAEVKPSTGAGVTIQWPSVPGKTYAIDCAEEVTKGFTNELVASVTAVSNFTVYTNTSSAENAYYRVRLVP